MKELQALQERVYVKDECKKECAAVQKKQIEIKEKEYDVKEQELI